MSTPSNQDYRVSQWGEGYFAIGDEGELEVLPTRSKSSVINFVQLVNDAIGQGMSLPLLIRFIDILHQRVREMYQSFGNAADQIGYEGGYLPVYPIKVNQQRTVVEEMLATDKNVGLEVGSKPELLAVLAQSKEGGVIICNGYKDREYVRLALIGLKMGYRVYLVIDKFSEWQLIREESVKLKLEPLLGVRIRLAAIAEGNWQNSGGSGSKFGLTALQVHKLVKELRKDDALHCLKLLHSHVGSQIPQLRHIQTGVAEAVRFYVSLRQMGAPLEIMDVGGGLGIDYEGSKSHGFSSMGYSLGDYAQAVLQTIKENCDHYDQPHPLVVTEAGRAMTAHHAVLVTNVTDREVLALELVEPLDVESHPLLDKLAELVQEAPGKSNFDETERIYQLVVEAFSRAKLSFDQRVNAESYFNHYMLQTRDWLEAQQAKDKAWFDDLNKRLSDRLFCNFSLFQSLPDSWGLDQVFPTMPLQRLREEPSAHATMHDLTCDSDGAVKAYVTDMGIEHTLPVHMTSEGENYLIGIFLLGAYQEILGDMHNLFGDTDAVNVVLNDDGSYSFADYEPGDTVEDILRYVHFDTQRLQMIYRGKLKKNLPAEEVEPLYNELVSGLKRDTYLKY